MSVYVGAAVVQRTAIWGLNPGILNSNPAAVEKSKRRVKGQSVNKLEVRVCLGARHGGLTDSNVGSEPEFQSGGGRKK